LQEMKQDGFTEKALVDGVQKWEARSRVDLSLK
jgi:polar amino acid transport system substrate-binding protein